MTSSSSRYAEWWWLWREVRPFLASHVVMLMCVVLGTAIALAGPLLVKFLIDDVLPARRWDLLIAVAAGLLTIAVGRLFLTSLGMLIGTRLVQRVTRQIHRRLVAHVQALPPEFHARHATGELVQRLERDVGIVCELGTDLFPALLRMAVDFVLTMGMMLYLDWRVAVIVLPLIPVFAWIRERYRTTLERHASAVRTATGRQSAFLHELLFGVIQIQLLGAERRWARRFARFELQTMRQQMAQRKLELTYILLSSSVMGLGTALIVGYGGARVMMGTLTPGGLVAFWSYVGGVLVPFNSAVQFAVRLQRVRVSIRRLMDLEQESAPVVDPSLEPAVPAHLVAGAPRTLAFEDVSFAYHAGTPALLHVAFRACSGEKLAIIGETGSGKSTLLKLIPRLHDPMEGRISLDGRDLRALPLRTLRDAIAFVPQEPLLFAGTLSENLRMACPAATPTEIAHAAWVACLTEVVERLPRGWETELGPMGVGLSGGERQRFAIARALLQRRPILILDEATSALDAVTEQRLLARLSGYAATRLVIVVSHRPAAVEWADRVIAIGRGAMLPHRLHNAAGMAASTTGEPLR